MKTFKIITNIITLNLVLFMSVYSIANPYTCNTGDIVKISVKNQTDIVKSSINGIAPNVLCENEFSHLRFDVNKFNTESGATELPLNSLDYLRFDASNYSEGITSVITELPSMNEFNYLRFDAIDFTLSSELAEMPVNDFGFLRFDVNRFSTENTSLIEALPESR